MIPPQGTEKDPPVKGESVGRCPPPLKANTPDASGLGGAMGLG